MRKLLLFLFLFSNIFAIANENGMIQYEPYQPDGVPFCVAEQDWMADSLGNHRAVVKIEKLTVSQAVKVVLKWCRADLNPESKGILIYGAKSGQRVEKVFVASCSAEQGEVWFQPVQGEDTYFLYYLPCRLRLGSYDARYEPQWNDYLPYDKEKGDTWKQTLGENQPIEAKVLRFEARNQFEFFTQMGNIATREEEQAILEKHPENPILFPEDRLYPIRLQHHLPVRWRNLEPKDEFEGTALRNEYYVWQIGLWAAREDVRNVKVKFSDMKLQRGDAVIPAKEMTCFNQEGTNWDGRPIDFKVDVARGDVQALWCGVQVPENALAGDYSGKVTLMADGMISREIAVILHVQNQVLTDHGDDDLWRMSRLRWLNSRIGQNDLPVAPYQAMKLKGKTIQATEKKVRVADDGMIASIVVNKQEVLERPMSLEVETANGTLVLDGGKAKLHQDDLGLVTWENEQSRSGIHLRSTSRMEYDGYIHYQMELSSSAPIKVKDVRLKTFYTPYAQQYMMGIGLDGGYRPKEYEWEWKGPYDSYWMGGVEAGLHVEFRGGSYHGPLLNDYDPEPPAAWANAGRGRIRVSGEDVACVTASTGEVTIGNEPLRLEFALNITPVKPLDTKKQFGMRFFHSSWRDFDLASQDGANICNIHHATDLNPVINYPFVVQDSLQAFIRHEHEQGRKVKLYYTIRELTDHVAEIFALKSLGGEILSPGNGRGAPWLCEHLIDNYRPAWYVSLKDGLIDAAFVLSPHSRWINYYLEGYRWMLQHYEIDGLYMDDVSFDRTVMKRMRKIMAQYRPESIIDLHSNTAYSCGPANQYTEFFPYVDRLWFGEWFKYNQLRPDEWLVTVSGIPFGLMSEMLQDGGNRYLGMVYGSTARFSWDESSPVPMWKLWREFGIEDARMVGYWDEKCPVSTSDSDVKATAYVREGQVLVAMGNFSGEEKNVKLTFDWKQLKMKPEQTSLTAPEVENFQPGGSYDLTDTFVIPPKRGKLLILKKKGK